MTLPQDLSSRFQVLNDIGNGPTGASYQVQDSQTGRSGLLKVLDGGAGVPAAERQRIKRELAKQVKLSNPKLPALFECSSAEPLWLFREYVEGETLEQRIARGPLPLPVALSITAQIAAALDELHRAGLLHRDLKPAHVVVRPNPDGGDLVSVIDAGIAARIETGTVFDVIGTAGYVSPEQVLGKLVSFRSDLYALGCILFEMLTGRAPFQGADAKAVLEAHKSAPIPALSVSAPAEVVTLLNSLLAKEPRSRPFSAQQVRRAVEPFLPASASNAPRRGSLPPAPAGQPLRTSPGLPAPVQPKPSSQAAADDVEELSADELEAIEPTVMTSAPSAMSTGELSPVDLEDDEDEDVVAAAPGATMPATVVAAPNHEDPPASDATVQVSPVMLESIVETSREETTAPKSPAEMPGKTAQATGSEPATKRPAVAFDVESLFDEDAEPAPSESDVTRVFRPIPEDAAAQLLSQAASEAEPDPDRTVVVRNPFAKSGPDKRVIAAVAGALVILLFVGWMALDGDESSDTPAASADTPATAQPADKANAAEPNAAEPNTAADTLPSDAPNAEAAPEAPNQPAAQTATQDTAEPANAEAAARQAQQPTTVAEPAPTADNAAPTKSAPTAAQGEPENTARTERRSSTPRPQAAPAPASGQSADELRTLARAEFQARRYKEAARYYQQAAAKAPSDAGTHAGLGASLLAAGEAKPAIAAYQRAIQLAPTQSGFHAALGRAYFQLGDNARAIASYRKAIELDPNNGVARAALARLED